MSRYFFDIHDGVTIVDEAGRDLPDLTMAKLEAMKIASEFVVHPKMLGADGGAIFVAVRDATDKMALKIRLVFNIEQ